MSRYRDEGDRSFLQWLEGARTSPAEARPAPAIMRPRHDDPPEFYGTPLKVPQLRGLSKEREPSVEAAQIVARVAAITSDMRFTCARIVDLCLPSQASARKEGCAYSLRDEVYRWVAKGLNRHGGIRIMSEHEYVIAVKRYNAWARAVGREERPQLHVLLKEKFGWEPPPPQAVKPNPRRPLNPPRSRPGFSSGVVFDPPPVPKLTPEPAATAALASLSAPALPPALAKEMPEVPGTTDIVRARRRRIIDVLKDRGPMAYGEIRRAVVGVEGVIHHDLRELAKAGLIHVSGPSKEQVYRVP